MIEWTESSPLILAIATLIPAVGIDIRERRIPNSLCLTSLVAALALHWLLGGVYASVMALGGALLLTGIVLPLFALGWFGAGDVKLIAAMGAIAGEPATALIMLAAIALAGGFLALCIRCFRKPTAPTVEFSPTTLESVASSGFNVRKVPTKSLDSLPYAVAVATGALAILLAQTLDIGLIG